MTIGGEARLDDTALLELATEIEGHPDNVAACLLGGFTLSWMEGGAARAIRTEPADSIVPVVFVPGKAVLTETARGLLPRTVPHVDAAANAGRAALLVEALTRRPELLLPATEDRLHQDYRAPAMPESAALVERLRADGIPAVISGAGPTVLALADADSADKVAHLAGRAGPPTGWNSTPTARACCRSRRPVTSDSDRNPAAVAGFREGECLLDPVVLISSLHPTPPWRGASRPRPGQTFFREPPKPHCVSYDVHGQYLVREH